MKNKQMRSIAIGFVFSLIAVCAFVALGVFFADTAIAETEITSSTVTWTGEMSCLSDVTIANNVSVLGNTTLRIARGKTLTVNGRISVNGGRTLTIEGPGDLVISLNDGGSDGALKFLNNANFIMNDGRVLLTVTGESDYGVSVANTSTLTLNDGALIVNGGKKAGIKGDYILLNRGLLRVHATGTDGTMSYGILAHSLTVGNSDALSNRPTLEVVEPSTQSCAISKYPSVSGAFNYECGFVELQCSTNAIASNERSYYDALCYEGNTSSDAIRVNGISDDHPYVFIAHEPWSVRRDVGVGGYLFTVKSGRKEDSLAVSAVGTVATFEGRATEADDLTDFDQLIKDLYCPMAEGPYGIVKDLSVNGGSGKLAATARGFTVGDYFLGQATVSGKYTYFNGVDYSEVPFEFVLSVATEVTEETDQWAGKTICTEDVTIDGWVSTWGSTELYIAAGKTLTINEGFMVGYENTFTFYGPGNLVVNRANAEYSSEGAFTIDWESHFILNDGRVIVNSTGTGCHGLYASDDQTSITINDGALIVNGGTQSGVSANDITVNRGLLRVRSFGTDGEPTYGIRMQNLIVGIENDYAHRPTVEVIEPSTESYAIANFDDYSGSFHYNCGFVEAQASTRAIRCHATWYNMLVEYRGTNAEDATTTGSANSPYVFLTHDYYAVKRDAGVGDYCYSLVSGKKSDGLIAHAVGTVATMQGRASVEDPLTDFDQYIKDIFCPMAEGPYGVVKDISVSGGEGKLSAIERGFVVSDYFIGTATLSGKYTYFNGTDYTEVPFELELTVATEITSGTSSFGAKMVCVEDVTIDRWITMRGCAELYVDAGATLTLLRGLRVNSGKTLKIYGPGKIVINKADEIGSYAGAISIDANANLILEDGYVQVNATRTTKNGVYGGANSTITINDGAFVVNGGIRVGINANVIEVNRGLLRVHATGTDGTKTYGILMKSMTVGISGDYTHRPTVEVVEPSTNGFGIANPEPSTSGDFYYHCGFAEIESTTQAFEIHTMHLTDVKAYTGNSKEDSALGDVGTWENVPYYFFSHQNWHIPYATDYDYMITLNSGRKEDGIHLTPTGKTFTFEGRASAEDPLTDFDQFVKDFFYPIMLGPYGTVTELVVTGANGRVIATDKGFLVKGKYNGPATLSGKYTYFDGAAYQEEPFEIGIVISKGPDLTYTAAENVLTATYGTIGTYDLTLVPPANLAYSGSAKTVTFAPGYAEEFFMDAEVKYFIGAQEVDACVNVNAYIAKLTFDDATAQLSFTVTQKEIGLVWSNAVLSYNGRSQKPAVSATGVHDSDAVRLTVTGAATAPGNYTATVTAIDNANYKLPDNLTCAFTIAKANLDLSVEVLGWDYGAPVNLPSVNGNVSGAAATIRFKPKTADDSAYSSTFPTDAGEYVVKVSVAESANYNGGFAVTDFAIAKRVAAIEWNAADLTYNGSAQAPTAYVTNLEEGDEVIVIVDGAAIQAGNYTATAIAFGGASAANYALPTENLTCAFSIAEAPVEPPVDDPLNPTSDPTEPVVDPTDPTDPTEPTTDPTEPTVDPDPENPTGEPSDPTNDPADPENENGGVNNGSNGAAVAPKKHGFCIGWIAFIVAMIELILCAVIILLRSPKVLFFIGLGVGAGASVLSLVAVCVHVCPIGVVSVILAPVVEAVFVVLSLTLAKKSAPKSEEETETEEK